MMSPNKNGWILPGASYAAWFYFFSETHQPAPPPPPHPHLRHLYLMTHRESEQVSALWDVRLSMTCWKEQLQWSQRERKRLWAAGQTNGRTFFFFSR